MIAHLTPPQQTAGCRTLGASPRYLRVGRTSIVLVVAKNRFGSVVKGVTVDANGVGLGGRATTDARGLAHFTLTPPRSGLVAFSGSLRTTAAVGPGVRDFLAVLESRPGSVTG